MTTRNSETRIAFYAPQEIKDKFKESCFQKGSTLSNELRIYMVKVINEQLNQNQTSKV